MRLVWTPHAWDDYKYWQNTDKATVQRINKLLDDCMRHPFEGIGKPEPLQHFLAGYWSRRIDDEHRLVYQVENEDLMVIQTRFHYQ